MVINQIRGLDLKILNQILSDISLPSNVLVFYQYQFWMLPTEIEKIFYTSHVYSLLLCVSCNFFFFNPFQLFTRKMLKSYVTVKLLCLTINETNSYVIKWNVFLVVICKTNFYTKKKIFFQAQWASEHIYNWEKKKKFKLPQSPINYLKVQNHMKHFLVIRMIKINCVGMNLKRKNKDRHNQPNYQSHFNILLWHLMVA